jgi:thiosulfate/3-mercaptopyruvate sulfurtransferase
MSLTSSFALSLAPIFLPAARRLAVVAALAFGLATPAVAESVTPLVSPQWLKASLKNPNLVVLDIRSAIDGGGVEVYSQGHIPGAVHSDYDKGGWRVTRNGVPFMLPTVAELEKVIGETGIDEDNHVVIVPAGVHVLDFGSAARVYWTLKVAGLVRVSILDGGFAAWKNDPANPIETGINRPAPKIFTATLDKNLFVQADEVERASKFGNATLLDARPSTFFAGKDKAPAAKAYGRIPGARNIDSAEFYDPNLNRLRSRDELAAIAAVLPDNPTVNYCNTGHWASTNWFVLSELLGRKRVTLYYGSMVEWTADARHPVESGRTRWDDLKKAVGLGL